MESGNQELTRLISILQTKMSIVEYRSIIFHASKLLREIEKKDILDWDGWYPWNLLLLIKWAYEFGGKYKNIKYADHSFIKDLLYDIYSLENIVETIYLEMGNGPDKFLKLFRVLVYKQVWTHQGFRAWNIGRQIALFGELPNNHPISLEFHNTYGISIATHLELSIVVLVWLMKNEFRNTFQPLDVFGNFKYSDQTIQKYLKSISLTQLDVQNYLISRPGAIKNPILQFSEKSPFINFPLLNLKKSYLIYSKTIFEEMINTFYFSFVKRFRKGILSDDFGLIFENYVEEGLKTNGLSFFRERDLQHFFPKRRIVDFCIPMKNVTVLIESKSIKMRESVTVYPQNQQLQNELQGNIIKAIIQGFSTADAIINLESTIQSKNNFYLLIVTHDNLFLGPGEEIWDEFLHEKIIPELYKNNISTTLISPRNIIILSTHEFDLMMSILFEKWATLPEILEAFSTSNSKTNSRMFTIQQILQKYYKEASHLPLLDSYFRLYSENTLFKMDTPTNFLNT